MDVTALNEDVALIIVDMQEDFCEPNGMLAVKGGRELAAGINQLLDLPFKLKIVTQDWRPRDHCSFASQHADAKPFTSTHTITNPNAVEGAIEEQTITLWPDHCVQDSPGAELIPELKRSNVSHIIKKGEDSRVESYSAFGPPFRRPAVGMSQLRSTLEQAGISKVIICGLAFDFCVKHTAIDAVEAGYTTYLVRDLTSSVNNGETQGVATELHDCGVHLVFAKQILR